jgi:hypothetical protein
MKAEKPAKLRRPFRIVPPRPQPAAFGREIQNNIGRQLRALHGNPVDEPVPDNIVRLLRRMDAAHKQ